MNGSKSMTDERYELGIEFIRKYRGDEATDAMIASLKARGDRFTEYSISHSYGDVYLRDGLDLKLRELITLAIVATVGDTADQLKIHVDLALKMGAEPVEIVETIIQVGAYAGAPRCSQAMKSVQAAFEAAGIKVP